MTITQILKSKTMIFAVLLAVLSASQALIVELPLNPFEQGVVGVVVAAGVAVLRILTSVPLTDK